MTFHEFASCWNQYQSAQEIYNTLYDKIVTELSSLLDISRDKASEILYEYGDDIDTMIKNFQKAEEFKPF